VKPIRRLSAFLHQLYVLQDEHTLVHLVVNQLGTLISGDNFMVGKHDPFARMPLNLCLRYPSTRPDLLKAVHETGAMKQHPLWELAMKPGGKAKMLSQMMTHSEWSEHPMYRDILREDNVRDHLTIDFRLGTKFFLMVGLSRGRRGFRSSEVELLELLEPHLKQAFSNARLVSAAGLDKSSKDAEVFTLYRVDYAARIQDWEGEKLKRFHACFGPQARYAMEHLRVWLRCHIQQLNRGSLDRDIQPYRIRHGTKIVEFRLFRQWGSEAYMLSQCFLHGADGPTVMLSIREREVLSWVREGKSNAEIAIILGMSTYTVKDHLKQIFRKLGVDNRTAAARMAGGRPHGL
jgi:DNA-binding CsgD family transcriptional regulator